jgi:hypothetical protein
MALAGPVTSPSSRLPDVQGESFAFRWSDRTERSIALPKNGRPPRWDRLDPKGLIVGVRKKRAKVNASPFNRASRKQI